MNLRLSLGCLLLVLACSTCDEAETGSNLRSEKAILQVSVPGVNATVIIDSVKNQVKVYLPSHTPSLRNLNLVIRTSAGASILAGYTDFTMPRTYTVRAEDGSTRDYAISVSQVNLARQLNNILPADLLYVYPDYCTQIFPGFLRVNLGCGPTSVTGAFRTTCLLDFRNKAAGTDLTGTYSLGQAASFPANVFVGIATNGNSSLTSWDRPNFGTLKVTSYNPVLKLITGSLQVQYNVFSTSTGDTYSIYGDFYNVPL